MYTLIKSVGFRAFLMQEAPYLVIAFLIASLFYKFGSFGVEAVAFLATWALLSALGNTLLDMLRGKAGR
jgi:predicted benzoate:H+ symporter BenE